MKLTFLQMKQAGFDDDQISLLLEQQRPVLKAAGFSDLQINKSLGLKPKSVFESSEDFSVSHIEVDNTGILASKPTTNEMMQPQDIKQDLKDESKVMKTEINKEEQKIAEQKEFIENKQNINNLFEQFAPELNLEDREILTNNVTRLEQSLKPLTGLDLARNKYGEETQTRVTGSGQYSTERIDTEKLKKPKIKIANPDTSTGPLSMRVLLTTQNPDANRNATPEELMYFNDFAGTVMEIESSARNIINTSGFAGFFQYGKEDTKSAVNRYKNRMKRFDPDYKTEEWIKKTEQHNDIMQLTIDQQKALFLADFLEKPANETFGTKGTDFYLSRILNGDPEASYEAYVNHHHAKFKINPETGKYELATDEATQKRAEEHFYTVFGSSNYGYKDAEQALLTKDGFINTKIPQKYLNKVGITLGTSPSTQSIYGAGHSHTLNHFIKQFHDITFGANAPEDNITPPEYLQKKYNEVFMQQPMTFGETMASGILTMVEDTPAYLAAGGMCYAAGRIGAGALAASGTGLGVSVALNASLPVVCGGFGMALPDAIRHTYAETVRTGQIGNVEELLNNFTDIKTAKVAAKSFAIGSLTVGSGQAVSKFTDKIIPRLAAETTTMTTVAAMLEGHVPTAKDFVMSAVLIGGVHMSIRGPSVIRDTLIDIYKNYSIHPRHVLKILNRHPEAKISIQKGEIPKIISEPAEKIHAKLMKDKGITIEPASRYEVNETVNISVSGERGKILEKTKKGPVYEYKIEKQNGETVNKIEQQIRKTDNSDLRIIIDNEKVTVEVIVPVTQRKKITDIDNLQKQKEELNAQKEKLDEQKKDTNKIDEEVTTLNQKIYEAERQEKNNENIKAQKESDFETFYEKNNSSKDGDNWGIPNDPTKPGATNDSTKQLFNNAKPLDLQDLVEITRLIMDKVPEIRTLKNGTRGFFQSIKGLDPKDPKIKIALEQELQKNPRDFTQTFAHEIGHLLDFLPEKTLAKGNILGSLATFKNYGNQWVAGKGDGAQPLNKKEINALKKRAENIAKRNEKKTDAEIKELQITPETVLQIFRDPDARKNIPPEFYDAFTKLSDSLKKEVVKDAMKGLQSPYLKAISDKINKQEVRPELLDKAQQIFDKLFVREMRKRGIIQKEDIMVELKELSQNWKPFDRTKDSKYTKYRDNPRELFADFMMAFLLRNKWTQNNAPIAYEVFVNHIDKNPKFKKIYQDLQATFMAGPDGRYRNTIENIEKMQQRTQTKTEEAYLDTPKQTIKGKLMDLVGAQYLDKFFYLTTRFGDKHQRWINNSALEAEYRYQRFLNKWSVGELYVDQMNVRVTSKLREFNYVPSNLGTMLFLRNLAESKQRKDVMNPIGVLTKEEPGIAQMLTERPVEEVLQYYKELHPELYKIADEFYLIRREYVIPELKESSLFTPEEMASIANNREYITFSVGKYIEKNIKDKNSDYYAHTSVKKTKGTLDDILNPFLTTIEKDLLLMNYARLNRFKKSAVDFMLKSKDLDSVRNFDAPINQRTGQIESKKIIEPVKYIGKNTIQKAPKDMEIFTYTDKGVLKNYYVDKWIADGFKADAATTSLILKSMQNIGLITKKFYTEYNVFWWNKALIDDVKNTIILNKDIKLILSKNPFLFDIIKAIGPSFYGVYGKGKPVKSKLGQKILKPKINEIMSKEGILMPLSEGYRGQQAGFNKLVKDGVIKEDDILLERILGRVAPTNKQYRSWWNSKIPTFFKDVLKGGKLYDRVVKTAFYMRKEAEARKTAVPLNKRETVIRTAEDLGAQNYAKKGANHSVTSAFMLYFNPYIRGFERIYKKAKYDTKGVAMRYMALSAFPTLIVKMATWGMFGKAMQELYLGVNDWDLKNSVPIPIGKTPESSPGANDGKVIYFKLPHSPEERFFTGIFYRLLSKFDAPASEMIGDYNIETVLGKKNIRNKRDYSVFSQIGKEGTPSFNPLFGIMTDLAIFAGGGNPYDAYKMRGALTRTTQDARDDLLTDSKANIEFGKYLMNNYFTGSYYTFQSADEAAIMREFEEITGVPVIGKGFEMFFKVGRYPSQKILQEAKGEFRTQEAKNRQDKESGIIKLFGNKNTPLTENEALELAEAIRNQSDNEFLKNGLTAKMLLQDGELQAMVKELLGARSKEEQAYMIEKVEQYLEKFEK